MLSGDYKFITHLFGEILMKFVILRAWNMITLHKIGFATHHQRLIVLFVIVYACVYEYVCLGSDEGRTITGRTFWSLEYCYLLNYREVCNTRFPEAFKICWESFLARLYHTIYTAFS